MSPPKNQTSNRRTWGSSAPRPRARKPPDTFPDNIEEVEHMNVDEPSPTDVIDQSNDDPTLNPRTEDSRAFPQQPAMTSFFSPPPLAPLSSASTGVLFRSRGPSTQTRPAPPTQASPSPPRVTPPSSPRTLDTSQSPIRSLQPQTGAGAPVSLTRPRPPITTAVTTSSRGSQAAASVPPPPPAPTNITPGQLCKAESNVDWKRSVYFTYNYFETYPPPNQDITR